jgi:hypothetical protein
LQWFLQTPLSVYTSPNISGPLLDWIGQGIYGIPRPTITSVTSTSTAGYDTAPYNTATYGARKVKNTGTATVVDDDIYKRVLTWHLYLGDGRQMSVMWMRRRIARFIFGANGEDIPADDFQKISITQSATSFAAALGTQIYNTQAYNTRVGKQNLTRHAIQIGVPNGAVGEKFQLLLSQGDLAFPFQLKFSVTFYGGGPPYRLGTTFILDTSTLS